MATDLKTSILINRQLPEFVREEYPLFQTFLEAYYEYLEQKQTGEKNDLIAEAKNLRYLSDVDYSIDEFEQQFFNTFASLFPKDVAVDKAFLIKHVLPLYLSKGSEKSFKLLFRILFGQELEVNYPKNNVLRASDGKWLVENIIRITTDIYSEYQSDGTNKEFYLIEKPTQNTDISIVSVDYSKMALHLLDAAVSVEPYFSLLNESINGRKLGDLNNSGLVTSADAGIYNQWYNGATISNSIKDYIENIFNLTILSNRTKYASLLNTTSVYLRPESQKIAFDSAIPNGEKVLVYYNNLNYNIFSNRKINGVTSGATAIVEKTSSRYINNQLVVEFYINNKTLDGEFDFGEKLTTDIIGPNDELIDVSLQTYSSLKSITVIDGGANYNVGDPVLISAPESVRTPSALISKVFKGTVSKINVNDGGAGFNVGSSIVAVDYLPTQFLFSVSSVDNTGANTANTFTIYSDIISDVDPTNTILSASNWHFSGNTGGGSNLYSNISTVLSNTSYVGIGEIAIVSINVANAVVVTSPVLNAAPATVNIAPLTANTASYTLIKIDTFGSLGKMVIHDGGTGYSVGDELVFTNKPMSLGIGAEGEVSSVNATGSITKVEFVPPKLTGTANIQSSNVMVVGTGTLFTTELKVGNKIKIGNNTRTVSVIASDTSLNVNTHFGQTATSQKIRLWNKYLLGGQNYRQDKLPTVSVSNLSASGANISVTSIMGDGEDLSVVSGNNKPGEIQEIIITDNGVGLKYVPAIDLTNKGDGTATAYANVFATYESLPGRWTSSDSIISSSDRKLQGRNYYVDYSYVTTTSEEFAKYKSIFKQLIHPAGYRAYAEITKLDIPNYVESNVPYSNSSVTISGTANVVNNSIYVTGTNTKFNVANTVIFNIGSQIAINSEIRVISSIISNTNLAVTSAFSITTNNESIVILN
jgi:hypothetical protein